VTAEYKRRNKLILPSELSANNKFKVINTFTVPVVHYTAAIVQWPVNILKELERKTRKLLCLFWCLHLARMSTDYILRKIKAGVFICCVNHSLDLLRSLGQQNMDECLEHYLVKPLL